MDAATVSVTRFYTDIEEYARKAQVTSTQELSETTEIYEFEGFDKAYQTMLQNFADAVLTGAALIAPGEDGSKTLSLVNAAYLSAWQGRKVALPVDMDEYNTGGCPPLSYMMHTRAERKMLPSRQPARGAAARPASLEYASAGKDQCFSNRNFSGRFTPKSFARCLNSSGWMVCLFS